MKRPRTLILVFCVCLALTALVPVVRTQNVRATNPVCETGCLLPPPGLLGWWPGDGSADDIQLGGNGIVIGASFAPGLVKQAFSFDGVHEAIEVPDTPALHAITTAVTVDAWVNPQQNGGWFFSRRDPDVSEGISIEIREYGWLLTTLATDTEPYILVESEVPVIQFGRWQHVALTADTATGQVLLYVNGKPVASQFAVGSLPITGRFADVSHLFIGQRQYIATEGPEGAVLYTGLVDEVEVYNRALSPSQIQAIYFVGARGKCKPNPE